MNSLDPLSPDESIITQVLTYSIQAFYEVAKNDLEFRRALDEIIIAFFTEARTKAYLLERFGKCQLCGTTEQLDPAHLFSRAQHRGEAFLHYPANVILACRKCHGEIDGTEVKKKRELQNRVRRFLPPWFGESKAMGIENANARAPRKRTRKPNSLRRLGRCGGCGGPLRHGAAICKTCGGV